MFEGMLCSRVCVAAGVKADESRTRAGELLCVVLVLSVRIVKCVYEYRCGRLVTGMCLAGCVSIIDWGC